MKESIVGKYILEHWKHNDGYESRRLRFINRETTKQYISDNQRDVNSWDEEPRRYNFYKKKSHRFIKNNSELGFRKSITHLCNPEGETYYTVFNNPSEVLCEYSFDELFNKDLREIQNPENYPLKKILWRNEYFGEKYKDEPEKAGSFITKDFKIQLEDYYLNECGLKQWDLILVNKLKELFNREKIFYVWDEKINEWHSQSILGKSATFFHYNQFNIDKEYISSDENEMNRTISFWLFEDCLVFQYEEGKDTW